MKNIATLKAALRDQVPLVGQHWEQPLQNYAKAVFMGRPIVRHPIRDEAFKKLLDSLQRAARQAGHNEDAIEKLGKQLQQSPVLQTGPHCHLVIEPDAFFTHLFSTLGLNALDHDWYVSYAVSTVKFTESAKKGPGWLWLDGQNVNVFGLSRSRMVPFSICGRQQSMRFELLASVRAGRRTSIDDLRSQLPKDDFASASDAIKAANRLLWPKCFGGGTRFLQIDDTDVARLTAAHLLDTDSWLASEFFGNLRLLTVFLHLVKEVSAGPQRGWLKATTDYFWFIADGRLTPLRLNGKHLVDDSGRYSVACAPLALAAALLNFELVPSLFTAFLVTTILPGLRALGGSRQVIYYPMMRAIFLSALGECTSVANRGLADAIGQDHLPSAWGHRTIAPSCLDPWRLVCSDGGAGIVEALHHYRVASLSQASGSLPGFAEDPLWVQYLSEPSDLARRPAARR